MTFTAVLAVLLGVLFVVWPGQITIFFSRILAAAVMVAGAVLFQTYKDTISDFFKKR